MAEILFKEESYKTVGACMEVYNQMGPGFLEAVYQECLEFEFTDRNIPYVSQERLELKFKENTLRTFYVPDFVCYKCIIVEIKGVAELNDKFRAQMINYLRATGMKLGLLVNFGNSNDVQYERIVL